MDNKETHLFRYFSLCILHERVCIICVQSLSFFRLRQDEDRALSQEPLVQMAYISRKQKSEQGQRILT